MVPESCRWEYVREDDETVRRIQDETGCSEILAGLLAARGIKDGEAAGKFLDPRMEDMYSPFLMKGMGEAVERVNRAVDNKEKITVYGDYDVDGITSTSIVYMFLLSVGADVDYYLPDRISEGYGLNLSAVKMIAESGTGLLLTVDTGITAVKECRAAAGLGMDVVITDHHECLDELPEACAVVDAKQPGETYPYRFLAGCGTAYKLIQGLKERRGYEGDISDYLELAALGTVADIVPLTDENRIIASEGFRRMKAPRNMGLRKLLESGGYDFKKDITSGFIAFGIAPRLNAGGRMGDAARGVKLFTTSDEQEASAIAQELNSENNERKQTENLILKEVTDIIETSDEIKNSRIIVVSGEGWHHGVVGIVSSRIKEMYYRPNIILSVENGIATGSARSIGGFNLFEALCTCSDLMIKFGGHEAAAGMTLSCDNVPELTRRLNDYAAQHMNTDMLIPVIHPEIRVQPEDISIGLAETIQKMEPFGEGMPEPVAALEGTLCEVRAVGSDANTLRMKITDGSRKITCVGFRKGAAARYYKIDMKVIAAGTVSINEYMGYRTPELIISDVCPVQDDDLNHLYRLFALRRVTDDYRSYCDSAMKIPKRACQDIYRFLKKKAREQGSEYEGDILMDDVPLDGVDPAIIHIFTLMQVLCVFEELDLVRSDSSGPYLHYEFISGQTGKLMDSWWYRKYFLI